MNTYTLIQCWDEACRGCFTDMGSFNPYNPPGVSAVITLLYGRDN